MSENPDAVNDEVFHILEMVAMHSAPDEPDPNPVLPLLEAEEHPTRRAALSALAPMWDAVEAACAAGRAAWPEADSERHDRVPLAVLWLLDEAREAIGQAALEAAAGNPAVILYARAADLLAVLALAADHLPPELGVEVRNAARACSADDADAPVHDLLQPSAPDTAG